MLNFLLIPISCISAFILGRFRYQLFQLPVTFMGALFLQPMLGVFARIKKNLV